MKLNPMDHRTVIGTKLHLHITMIIHAELIYIAFPAF